MQTTMMDHIDLQIVNACNELIELKSTNSKRRFENSNERARLRRELDQKKREVDKKVRSLRLQKDLTLYRDACTEVFEEAGIRVPGLAAARQAQLCLHVHVMTIMDNQLEIVKRQGKRERNAMEVEVNRLREGIGERQIELLNQIVRLEKDIIEFEDWMNAAILKSRKSKELRRQHPEEDLSQPRHSESSDCFKEEADSSESSDDTAFSTPPSSPETDLTNPMVKEVTNTSLPSSPAPQGRRGSTGVRGSFMVPARPRSLMSLNRQSSHSNSSYNNNND